MSGKKGAEPPLIWVDLEMSGLDERSCTILEIAMLATDADLNELDEGLQIVVHQPESVLTAMDEWCTLHHAKSGLTQAVRDSTTWLAEAEERVFAYLSGVTKAGASPLAGNSIHVDRRFLAVHLPRVEAFLHYRNVDVSTLKEMAKRWYPKLARYEKGDAHRALGDIRASIGELKYYREKLFRAD